jgi:hypothetical protein
VAYLPDTLAVAESRLLTRVGFAGGDKNEGSATFNPAIFIGQNYVFS